MYKLDENTESTKYSDTAEILWERGEIFSPVITSNRPSFKVSKQFKNTKTWSFGEILYRALAPQILLVNIVCLRNKLKGL